MCSVPPAGKSAAVPSSGRRTIAATHTAAATGT